MSTFRRLEASITLHICDNALKQEKEPFHVSKMSLSLQVNGIPEERKVAEALNL